MTRFPQTHWERVVRDDPVVPSISTIVPIPRRNGQRRFRWGLPLRRDEVHTHLQRVMNGHRGYVLWPFGATQLGIAEALGISRGNVALCLMRLEIEGRVEVLLGMVEPREGVSGRRKKVYRPL